MQSQSHGASGFFAQYPRFFETSHTGTTGHRLALRHRALIESQRDAIDGKRVLDLASHDGRWSFAALMAGACYVMGIEARQYLVERARENLHAYGVPSRRCDFVQGDCLSTLRTLQPGQFDTVFCFGFLYHTLSHFELLRELRRLEPQEIIIDTMVFDDAAAIVRLACDEPRYEGAAIGTSPDSAQALVGIPTRHALEVMLQHLGFTCSYFDWASIAAAGVGVDDYRHGRHCTLRASRLPAGQWSWHQPEPQAVAPPEATARSQGNQGVGTSSTLASSLAQIPAVIVDGQALSLGQVLCEAFERQDTGFLEKAIRHHLIAARARAYAIQVQPAELARLRDIFRREQGLDDDEALACWLERAGLSQQQLDTQLSEILICGQLKGKVVEPQLEAYFHAHRAHFDRLVLLRLEVASHEPALRLAEILRSGATLNDLALRLAPTAEPSLAMSLYTQVYPVDLPESVGTLQAGEVGGPLWRQGLWEIFRVEARQPACLDQATHMRLHHLLFDQWLETERQRAEICIPLQLDTARLALPNHEARQLEAHA